MASYDDWNLAVLQYFKETAQKGEPGFLNVDVDAIRRMGESTGASSSHLLADFVDALRTRCVHEGRIRLGEVKGLDPNGAPRGATLLAAMVLASSRMGEDEKNNANAYYSRLTEILGLESVGVRPLGLTGGGERALWECWNDWVKTSGYIPTARRGIAQKDKYRGYAISQVLLRDVDKQSLRRTFGRFNFGIIIDGDELIRRLRKYIGSLTHHLRDILSDVRSEPASDRIFEVYEEWNESRLKRHAKVGAGRDVETSKNWRPFELGSKILFCGIVRREHLFTGAILFYLLPRFRINHGAKSGIVQIDQSLRPLVQQDARWWKPVGPITDTAVSEGRTYQVSGPDGGAHVYNQATLPSRDFWILVPDEMYGSDDLGTWRPPKLGERFTILAKKYVFSDLHPLHGKVLDWEGLPQPLENAPGWAELCDIRIVASDWTGIASPNQSLLDAIRPRSQVCISLSGGLRVPYLPGSWIEGCAPDITVFAVSQSESETIEITIVSPRSMVSVLDVTPNTPATLPLFGRGVWLIEVKYNGASHQSLVNIVDLDGVQLNQAVFGSGGEERLWSHYLPDTGSNRGFTGVQQ